MGDFLLYILKSSFCLILFYFFFKAVMSRTTFFRLNRYLIIFGLTLCLVLPFIRITVTQVNPVFGGFQQFEELFTLFPESEVGEVEVTNNVTLPHPDSELSVYQSQKKGLILVPTLLVVYLSGVCISAFIFLTSYFRMMRLIHRFPHKDCGDYILVLAGNDICSFSWGKYIVIAENDYLYNQEILLHETAHIRARHTWDLVYIHFFQVFQWFNPALWLIKRELQEIHEYQADSETINEGIDATKYQLLLVKKAVGTRLYSMANGFNHSKLKNRISMMLKERTNKYVAWRVLLLIPLMGAAVYLFAQHQKNVTPEINPITETETIPVSPETFFKEEFEEYLKTASPYDPFVKDSRSNNLWMNMAGKLMFNSDFLELDDNLVETIVSTVNQKRQKSKQKTNKPETQVINIVWDRSTSKYHYDELLKAVYKASRRLRIENINSAGENDSNVVYPMVVNLATMDSIKDYVWPKEERSENGIIEGVELSILTPGQKITLKDFTEKQLREEFKKVTSKSDTYPTISLKMPGDIKMGLVTDIKKILRDISKESEIDMNVQYQNGVYTPRKKVFDFFFIAE